MITTDEAESICENLGFTLEEATEAGQRVNEYVATLYLEREVQTSVELPDDSRIYRHQLVHDRNGRGYVVTEFGDGVVKLAEVFPPMPDEDGHGLTDVGFGATQAVTHGRIMMDFEPQYELCADSRFDEAEKVPVWAY